MSLNEDRPPSIGHHPASSDTSILMQRDVEMTETPTSSRPKGRKRFLHSLQRMSSSQSILRLPRAASSGYRGIGSGSISCISLSTSTSPSLPLGSSFGSQVSQGFSTAPTSIPSTPGETPLREEARIRYVGGRRSPGLRTPLSVRLPSDLKAGRPVTSSGAQVVEEDYFSCHPPAALLEPKSPAFDFLHELPNELQTSIFQLLDPCELVSCSRVSKVWYATCFDGQLWSSLDASLFYQKIPAPALKNIITNAGPFARHLNLRGCAQLSGRTATWLSDACVNLQSLSLQDCHLDRHIVHNLLRQNHRLAHLNLSGLKREVTNVTLRMVAQHCPELQHLDVSWCQRVDSTGLHLVVLSCPTLRELRAGEVDNMDNVGFMTALFESNSLETLVLTNCQKLSSAAFSALFEGLDSEKDYLTGRAIVPPRRLKHLDVSRCGQLDDVAVLSMVGHAPALEGLHLAKCTQVTDLSITQLLPTLPRLSHLDLEELDQLTNNSLFELAKSHCTKTLRHLNVSYCENLSDGGMTAVLKKCPALRSLELDNTRISDLTLIEAAIAIRARQSPASVTGLDGRTRPEVGLSMAVYDCQNVTWAGIREIMSRNSELLNARQQAVQREIAALTGPSGEAALPAPLLCPPVKLEAGLLVPPKYPSQIITLKVFYGYQPTVTEHTKRCMRGDFASAARLERKWAEYMIASEEAGAPGGFGPGGFGLFASVVSRRRRRRIREAAMMHADEEDEMGTGIGRRRRARSGGSCVVM